MVQVAPPPWFHAALQRLDLRRADRVLLLLPTPREVLAVAHATGSRGAVTVVQPDPAVAESMANLDLPQVEVLAHRPRGDERFGTFDALLAAPLGDPGLPAAAWATCCAHNLRPGGRAALDLPAPAMLPDLAAAWAELGRPAAALRPLQGPDDAELAAALRAGGLRRVEALLGAHLLALDSPFDLADLAAAGLGLDAAATRDVGEALVRRCGGTGPCEVLAHRTRVVALR